MAASKPAPALPQGPESSILSSLSESFAFHSSPESFITKRIQALSALPQAQNPLTASPKILRARVLNRNIAVVTSHSQITHVLHNANTATTDGSAVKPTFIAADAYAEFMAPFFPSPNLLLADGASHESMREIWEKRVAMMNESLSTRVSRHVKEMFSDPSYDHEKSIDLYETCKILTWRILLGLFLNLSHEDPAFKNLEALQETLLRGQFSLFPVSVTTPFWKSARRKGILAKEELQKVILQRIIHKEDACPFHKQSSTSDAPNADAMAEIANHILLFISSLSVKALASLLTAFLLNLFLSARAGNSLQSQARAAEFTERTKLLDSILLETERLSPPIVGIMRRAMTETVIPATDDSADTLIPKGWDVWLYFVGAGRDSDVFGEDSDKFRPERWTEHRSDKLPLAFSSGPKSCLGKDVVRGIVLAVGNAILDMNIQFTGEVVAKGVRAWLGWDSGQTSVDDWAKDVKQLPTQHPAEKIYVRVVRN